MPFVMLARSSSCLCSVRFSLRNRAASARVITESPDNAVSAAISSRFIESLTSFACETVWTQREITFEMVQGAHGIVEFVIVEQSKFVMDLAPRGLSSSAAS